MASFERRPPLGARRRRFVLERPVEEPDGFGGVLRRFVPGPSSGVRSRPSAPSSARGGGEPTASSPIASSCEPAPACRPPCASAPGRAASRSAASPIPTNAGAILSARSRNCRPRSPHERSESPSGLPRGRAHRFAADAALKALLGGSVRLYDEPRVEPCRSTRCSANLRFGTTPSMGPGVIATGTRWR